MNSKNNQPFRTLKKGSGLDALFGDSDANNSNEIDIDLIQLPVTVHSPHAELVLKSVKKIRGSSKC